jgi:broad specificity phosphatase PhoE
MKITFIRHSKVLFNWRKLYNTNSFDLACQEYDLSPVQAGKKMRIEKQPVYISNLIRTEVTAKNLFQDNIEVIKTDLLNEIPLKSFINTKLRLPTIIWMVLGRLQWYFNYSRQPETRKNSNERINIFLDHILCNGRDCVIIGHGFYFAQMVNQMKRRAINGDMRKRLKNEELRVFVADGGLPIPS